MKRWYQSKTVWFNIVSLILAALALPEFISLIPSGALPYIALLSGVGNIYLRMLTTQPINGSQS